MIDVAQIVLYVFWAFFFGLIFWLRREDRREGYPLESDNPRKIWANSPVLIPAPKTFILPSGHEVQAPNFERDTRPMQARRTAEATGAPFQPLGDPLLSGVGPATFCVRDDEPELTREGHDLIVPMRVAHDFKVDAGPDPRGWKVVGTDGKVAGVVKDLWVDRADIMVRYIEVELSGGGRRLLPLTMALVNRDRKQVDVYALRAGQFTSVPSIKHPDKVTLFEEEKIGAFYAGGRMYAEPKRLGPVI
jgi:photosynthetic reaction center H subunit